MVSEQRFKVDYEVGVLDTKTNEIICDTVNANEVVDLLNEFETKCHKLEKEIRLLKPTNIEQYEQIQKLQKENEQLRAINKKIGDDLYNCRLNKNIIREKLKLWQDVHKEYGIYSINDFEELMKNDK